MLIPCHSVLFSFSSILFILNRTAMHSVNNVSFVCPLAINFHSSTKRHLLPSDFLHLVVCWNRLFLFHRVCGPRMSYCGALVSSYLGYRGGRTRVVPRIVSSFTSCNCPGSGVGWLPQCHDKQGDLQISTTESKENPSKWSVACVMELEWMFYRLAMGVRFISPVYL